MEGLIFDIQSFSVHDGPGSRTTVFLKGCCLRCSWCSNPEGINPFPEVAYYADKCAKCNRCVSVCPGIAKEGVLGSRKKCETCREYNCVPVCRYDALRKIGRYMTVEEVLKKIQKDRDYWGSCGGITLSGGEPLLQHSFAAELLKTCHDKYIHTAIETSGNVPWRHFEETLEYLDWIFYDIKHMDDKSHRATGASNKLILENAEKIAAIGKHRLVFRSVIVPGYNDSQENMSAIADFMRNIGKDEINLLPLHRLGSSKYQSLGRNCQYDRELPPDAEKLSHFKRLFESRKIRCYLGPYTPF